MAQVNLAIFMLLPNHLIKITVNISAYTVLASACVVVKGKLENVSVYRYSAKIL